jgi:CRISPR-associated endoribonuclease Cas6
MRISCSFHIAKIPIHYRMAMVSIIKEALRTSDEAHYHCLYQGGQRTKPFDHYIFSNGRLKRKDNMIYFFG